MKNADAVIAKFIYKTGKFIGSVSKTRDVIHNNKPISFFIFAIKTIYIFLLIIVIKLELSMAVSLLALD